MKKYLLLLILALSAVYQTNAQSKGVKIGYIDMEYILQNVPDYSEAKSQLEQKAQKWKQDIEAKKIEIAKLKDALKTERALLTKELIDEREEEIKFQETELLDFQQKKFGPNGDLITQKAVLVKPIQDQVFTAVQDIAEAKKFDFVFDKASDLTMLFAAKRYDISDQVIRVITRAEKREQMSAKQVKQQEAKEALEDAALDANPALEARKKALEDKKKAREQLVADRKLAAETKKAEQAAKRAELLEAKNAKKTGTVPAKDKTNDDKATSTPTEEANKTTDSTALDPKAVKAAERAKLIAERKKALEDKKKKILEDREAAKKAKEDAKNKPKTE
ncbi:OmpH family outer membrane protein [Flavobacterium sp. AS60]|uniref:OmpH family outer membrane protein n=1 Tax=Flavobacterium anseongense TaxID=2910677 RepID=UPI001F421420|nr:OmpH family outer membrane protein [Flavobacterium sp. AS60]MCF6128401.1 OmpH family outer membrane protein [Flavobacterium sp. AS60]